MFLAVRIEDDEPTFACGSSTFVALELPGEEPVQLEAEVVRVEKNKVGLRFVDATEPNRRPLANFIMKQAHARQH